MRPFRQRNAGANGIGNWARAMPRLRLVRLYTPNTGGESIHRELVQETSSCSLLRRRDHFRGWVAVAHRTQREPAPHGRGDPPIPTLT
jgi:hypothetical protein